MKSFFWGGSHAGIRLPRPDDWKVLDNTIKASWANVSVLGVLGFYLVDARKLWKAGSWLVDLYLLLGILLVVACFFLQPSRKDWRRKRRILCIAALVILFTGPLCLKLHWNIRGPQIPWHHVSHARILPTPPSLWGEIYENQENYLEAELRYVSERKAEEYREDCRRSGYETRQQDRHSWTGEDVFGRKLTLIHDKKARTLVMEFECPEKLKLPPLFAFLEDPSDPGQLARLPEDKK